MSPIIWLASYPKCGNTWFRLMLANLGRSEPADINSIESDDGIASARRRFDEAFLFAAGSLTHEECDAMRPALYGHMRDGDGDRTGGLRFLKTHDAWVGNGQGAWLLGGHGVARGAVLILRDPRDVAASLANHLDVTLDRAIAFMARTDSDLSGSRDRQHLQLRQRLLGWSGYYASWLEQDEVPVHLLRYEDMQKDAHGALAGALAFLGVGASDEAIGRAVAFSSFAQVREQEERSGFREAPVRMSEGRFFRHGLAGGWRHELTSDQLRAIEAAHGPMMRRLGYEAASCLSRSGERA